MRALFIFLTCGLISSAAFAEALLDFGATYTGDTLSAAAESANTKYFYNLNLLFNLDRRARWNFGWTVMGISQSSTADSTQTTYSSMDLGPALRWNIDRSGIFSFTVAYGYLAKGAYASGSTAEAWEGTSYFGQFAIQAPIREDRFYVGLSFNYYAASYSVKTVDNVESANDAKKTWIFPMLSLTWRP